MAAILPRDSLAEVIFGPTVFMVFYLAAYAAVGGGCGLGWQHVEIIGLDGVRALVLALGCVSALVLVVGGVILNKYRREALRRHGQPSHPSKVRRHFLPLSSLILTGMSLLGVVWVTAALFLVPMTCEVHV